MVTNLVTLGAWNGQILCPKTKTRRSRSLYNSELLNALEISDENDFVGNDADQDFFVCDDDRNDLTSQSEVDEEGKHRFK